MPSIPLFGLGQTGKSVSVSAQSHLNIYAEPAQDPEKGTASFHGTPGLTLFTSFGDTPIRGWIAVGDYIYAVHRGTFWQVDNAGIKTSRGALSTTSGRVSLAYNGSQIGIVDGASMYCFTIASLAFSAVSSALFSNTIDITYQDSYFLDIFLNSQQFQLSASNDGTTFDALDFASTESNPDKLTRIVADHGEIVLCGDQTVEFWSNSGAQDFPYSNQRGATLEYGLAAPWSLVKYNDSLVGLFRNRMGQTQVMVMRGHSLQKISTNEIDFLINNYMSVADATAFSYMLGGHPMLQINFPTDGKSWLYDAASNMWSSLESGLNGGRHRAEMHVDYLNKPRVSDYSNGNIYTIDPNVYTDNGTTIPREIIGRHVFTGDDKVTVHKLQIDFETGVGLISGQGSDPQAMLQISRDGGHTYGNERWTSLGAIGSFIRRAIWRRCGSSRDFLFKVRVTDPVKFCITGASAAISNE